LWPGSRKVETLQSLKVSRQPGGFAEILPDPVIAEHAPFRVEPPDVKFVVDGVQAALIPKPPLLGLQGLGSMLDHSAVYGERAKSYVPAEGALDALRANVRPIRVRVFFGSWCPACGQMVPRLMRVAQELGDEGAIEVEYYGLPRGFAGEPQAEKYGIRSVPSAVVFSGDAEIGRINGDQWRSPEQTLVSLLGRS
jgi:thiol-disulfide isomerase/thioredoxin